LDDICSALGRTLEIPLTAGQTSAEMVSQIGSVLSRRGRMLVVLEHFEAVVEHAAATVARWLTQAPHVEFLVTSRELLHLPAEQPWEVSPLSMPEKDDVAGSEAVQLFVERARSVRQGYNLTAAESPLVAQIVRELDGIPLAIELAAARMGVLSAAKLLERLPRRFDLLTGGKREGSSGRSTLRGAIDWSWRLLQPAEQSALSQCSVFRGDFSLDAAEEVIDLSDINGAAWVMDVLEALKEKSLVRAIESKQFPGEVRFSLYVTIREYAAEKLNASTHATACAQRHGRYYLRVGSEWQRSVDAHGGMEKLRRLALEQENLLAVHQRSLAAQPRTPGSLGDALQVLLALDPVLSTRGPFGVHLSLLDETLTGAIEAQVSPSLLAQGLEARARARQARGRMADSMADIDAGLAKAREASDRRTEAVLLDNLGKIHQDLGKKQEARSLHEQALALFRAVADQRGEARALQRLGGLFHDEEQLDSAREYYEKALSIFRAAGDRRSEGSVLGYLAILNHEQSRLTPARVHYEKALAIFREVEDLRLHGITLGYLGLLHQDQGNLDKARAQYERAVSVIREAHDQRYEGMFLACLGGVQAGQGHLEDANASFEEARTLLTAAEDPLLLAAAELHQGHLEVAVARSEMERGNKPDAQKRLRALQERIAAAEAPGPNGGRPVATQTDETRFALRFLKQAWAEVRLKLPE
jgi:predicted ATPase